MGSIAGAKLGTANVCRVLLKMDVSGGADGAEVRTTSRWVAPDEMADSAAELCDEERRGVLERVDQILVPPPSSQ